MATRPLRVGLHPAHAARAPEVKYTLRTLLRVAGLPVHFRHAGPDATDIDVYYGPLADAPRARVCIAADPEFDPDARLSEPAGFDDTAEVPLLRFEAQAAGFVRDGDRVTIRADIVRAAYWLLAGGAERDARPDARGNLRLEGAFLVESPLLWRPLVSLYGAFLRKEFASHEPLSAPWCNGTAAAVAFTHDVDYPQAVRWIESLRLLRARRPRARTALRGLWSGAESFWKFDEWVDFAMRYGTRPAFYFMTRRGSLIWYALGTPDAFYDIRSPAFTRLFAGLREQGCEIGLHASYDAYREPARIGREKAELEKAAGTEVIGNRHHYWHLDPRDPAATLRAHEDAGLLYDSSLALEFYPGYRRGICHPFRPYHPGERRALEVVQLPPAWMDDHFGRRRAVNGITDPDAVAGALIAAARETNGIAVLDYHVRGWNHTFFPEWGAWLQRFARERFGSDLAFRTPAQITREYLEFERRLDASSADET